MSEADDLGRQWLRRAQNDLNSAEAHHVDTSLSPATTCWLAQQAAEKAIKALLVRAQVDFPFTHDLAALSLLLGESLPVPSEDLVHLTKVASDSRYPGEAPEPVRDDADTLLAIARTVVAEAARRFDGKG
ncbi:MAG: HEPN domain-containing protein [Actinobacteria bacterium]|nr:HEPN domain-containing protein [Actinomycetota bacterium]